MCDRRTLVWLPLVSLAMLTVLSGQGCPGIGRPSDCLFNTAPVADAGPDQEPNLGAQVTLDAGGSSDVDGDALSYQWQKIRGPEVVLNNPNSISPWFVASAEGEYEFTVTVSDECGASDTDTVRISVSAIIICIGTPEARARTDQDVIDSGAIGSLKGSGSVDPQGCSLSFSWRQTGGPGVDIINPYLADTSFTAPVVTQDVQLVFELMASNGSHSDTDMLTITVRVEVPECVVRAEGGPKQTANMGSTVVLDGSASSDSCHRALTWSWSQTGGQPAVALSGSQTAKPTFVAPQVEITLVFQVVVSNGSDTATDTVTVVIVDPNADLDNDGIRNNLDNCPNVANASQENADGDTAGDACDDCSNDPNKTVPGQCGCGVADTDTDGDDVADCSDQCPSTPADQSVDANGCADSQKDGDDDGVKDDVDQCPNTPGSEIADAAGCSCSQRDGDSDGVKDCDDACPDTLTGAVVDSAGCPVPDTEMALIPAGEFQMGDSFGEGDSDELPCHVVYVDAFCMDRTEVTNAQYAVALNWAKEQSGLITLPPFGGVVYEFGGASYPYCNTTASGFVTHLTWDGTSFGVTPGRESHPVVRVTWWGAVAYANWRSAMSGRQLCYDLSTWNCDFSKNGYRLPTEAEWEKAARGGVAGRRFPWSDTDTIQHTRANYYSLSSCSYDTGLTRGYHPLWGIGVDPLWTGPVGFFNGELRHKVDFNWPGSQATYQTTNGANGYGLYDMAGNVWEWCNDWYSSTYYSTPEASQPNPRGPTTSTPYRVIRGGGSFGHASDWCRVADRAGGNGPDAWSAHVGFRLARNSE